MRIEKIEVEAPRGKATISRKDGKIVAHVALNVNPKSPAPPAQPSSLHAEGSVSHSFVRDVLPGFADGRIVPVIDKVFPFNELPAAKAYVETNAQLGKVVVKMA